MANISKEITDIRGAVVGLEIRGTIADGLEAMNTEVINTTGKQSDLAADQEALGTQFTEVLKNTTSASPNNAELVAGHTSTVTGITHDTIGKRMDNNDTQLANKAQQVDLNTANINLNKAMTDIIVNNEKIANNTSAIINIASGSPKGVYVALANISADANAVKTAIYITSSDGKWSYWNSSTWVAGGVYQSTGLSNGVVDAFKMAYDIPIATVANNKNKFNKLKATFGYYVLSTDGVAYPLANYYLSDYMLVLPNTNYYSNKANHYAFYTASKVYITGASIGNTLTSPSNASYVRTSVALANFNTYQFEFGNSETTYEDGTPKIGTSQIYDYNSSINAYPFAKTESKNLFDASKITTGNYLNTTNGTLIVSATFNVTDYCNVNSFPKIYCNAYLNQSCFYDVKKVFISGVVCDSTTKEITIPINAYYFRTTIKDIRLAQAMFSIYSFLRYETYKQKVIKSLLPTIGQLYDNVIIVSQNGNGDYTSIIDAVANAGDSITKKITIIVMPGIYIGQVSIRSARNISIIGTNKKDCIIIDHSGEYWKSPLEIGGDSYIANMTIIADSTEKTDYVGLSSYAIHADFEGEGTTTIFNCDLITYQHATIGIGLHNNQTIILDNCYLYNRGGSNGLILAHNDQFNNCINQKLIVNNCIGISDSGVVLELTDANLTLGDGGDAHDTSFTFYNSMFFSETLKKTNTIIVNPSPTEVGKIAGNIALSEDSYGNNLSMLNA